MTRLKRISVLLTGLPGLPGTNTIYGHEDGVSAADQVDAVFNFYDTLASTLNDALTINVNPIVEIIDPDTGSIIGTDDTGAGGTTTGGNGTDLLPFASQMLIQFRTGAFFTGRELRGRIFVPGFGEDVNTDGRPASTLVSGTQSIVDSTLLGKNLAVYSPTKHQWASIESAPVWTEWAVLRSRRP